MKIKAILPWAGSKRNLAHEIIAEAGDHVAWWDLCFGSCSATLQKPIARMETIVDMNADLVNLALCIQDDLLCEMLEESLHRTWTVDDIFKASAAVIRSEKFTFDTCAPNYKRAYHYFIFCWMGRNGAAGTKKVGYTFSKRYTKSGGHGATRFRGVVDSLNAFNERMRNITVIRGDIFEEIPRIEDAEGVVIYVDPPYLIKGLEYIHDFTPEDHVRLAKMLGQFRKARVIVSYYDHADLEILYPGWTTRRFDVLKALANSARRGSRTRRAVEVLLINGPSLVETKSRSLFAGGLS